MYIGLVEEVSRTRSHATWALWETAKAHCAALHQLTLLTPLKALQGAQPNLPECPFPLHCQHCPVSHLHGLAAQIWSLSGQQTYLQVSDTQPGLGCGSGPHFSLHLPKGPRSCAGLEHCSSWYPGLGGSLHNSIQSSKGGDRASQDFSNSQGPGYGSKCHFYCSDNVVLEGGPKPG